MTKTKKRLIPFGWLPGHWGMAGKMRDVAQAEYELAGEELARRLIEINIGERSDVDLEIAALKVDFEYDKINDQEFEKSVATAKNEPWVTVKTLETDSTNPRYGGVELDWNDAFVQNLEKHGYGPSPEQDDVVNEWFNDLCRNIALDAYDGVGDLQDRIANEENTKTGMHEDAIPMSAMRGNIESLGDDDE